MKKRLASIILALCIIFSFTSSIFAAQPFNESKLYTDTFLVMDIKTGVVLASNNDEERMYPASLTKMLTALVVYDVYTDTTRYPDGLNTMVTADSEAVETEPTKYYLKEGEEMTVDNALNIMLLKSANDIAVMFAKNISGSIELFAKKLNDKALELGCTNSNFVTPNGLHDDNHYSTASDLAKIALALLNNEYLAGIVSQEEYNYSATNKQGSGTVYNTNALIAGTSAIYVGAEKTVTKYSNGKVFGVKTGTTPEAGGCLIAAVERDDTQILVVILNSRSSEWNYSLERYADAHLLLNWAFDNYETNNPFAEGTSYGIIKVKKGEFNKVDTVLADNVFVTLPLDDETKTADTSIITHSVDLAEAVQAPIAAGTRVGSLHVYQNGKEIGNYPIITKTDIAEGGILSVFGIEDAMADKIFKITGIVLGVIALIVLVLTALRHYNKRKARLKKEARAKRAEEKKLYMEAHPELFGEELSENGTPSAKSSGEEALEKQNEPVYYQPEKPAEPGFYYTVEKDD